MRHRRASLLWHAGEMGYDALVAFEPENLFYMTGFWGEAVGLLEYDGMQDSNNNNNSTNTRTTIIVPQLEAERARSESEDCDIVVATGRGSNSMISTLAGLLGTADRRACTDCRDYSTMESIKKFIPEIKQSSKPFDNSRMLKDDGEITILKDASQIIDEMFDLCSNKITVGQSESELQAILMSYAMERQMFDTGYRFTLNPLIIAGGPNGALPHAQVTQRRFQSGELVVVDITLRYKGYVSDATRTFALGQIPPRAAEAYEIVRESQQLGLDAARHGASCSDVDAACRQHINQRGFGQYFIHSTGHGIGLDVHEPPAVSLGSDTILAGNMAVTVEPGIYIADEFGIRIEDSLVIGRDAGSRPDVLHHFTKEMIRV